VINLLSNEIGDSALALSESTFICIALDEKDRKNPFIFKFKLVKITNFQDKKTKW
jgi:hypothetical protein